jgi:rubredoxin
MNQEGIEEKIKVKLKKRLEEETKEAERQTIKEQESERQDELLKHHICPRCGEDTKEVFSLGSFLMGEWKKMKCISCGFVKKIYLGWCSGSLY